MFSKILQGFMLIMRERLDSNKSESCFRKAVSSIDCDDREALAYADTRQCHFLCIDADNQRVEVEEYLSGFLACFFTRSQWDRSCVDSKKRISFNFTIRI